MSMDRTILPRSARRSGNVGLLGHTGRPLVVSPVTTVAYVSIVLAVAVRVFGPALLPMSYTTIMVVAGSLWVLTFLLFTIVYVPILLGPRVDGKTG